MILVTVGTEKFPFNRLMRWVDQLLEDDLIGDEEVVVQYGTCTDLPGGRRSIACSKNMTSRTWYAGPVW